MSQTFRLSVAVVQPLQLHVISLDIVPKDLVEQPLKWGLRWLPRMTARC